MDNTKMISIFNAIIDTTEHRARSKRAHNKDNDKIVISFNQLGINFDACSCKKQK